MKILLILLLITACGDETYHRPQDEDTVTVDIQRYNPRRNEYFIERRVGYSVNVKYRLEGEIYTEDMYHFDYRLVPGGWVIYSPYDMTEVVYFK